MTREIELKFTGSVEAIEKLRRSQLFKSLSMGRARTAALRSIYFDTAAQDLAQRGVSLRIRKDGAKLTQTVKSLNGKTAPRWDRAEQDAPISNLNPDPQLIANPHVRKALSEWQDRGELMAMFETDFKRTAILLKANGGAQIEAAFDFGTIKAMGSRDGLRAPLAELELELKKGDPGALFKLARDVARAAPLRFALESKADRGYNLAQGSSDRAVRARPLKLDADMSSSDAFRLIQGEGLRQIIANENAILRARDVEGVHQMRVAIRRLRSAMAAFGKAYDHGEMDRLKRELAWLARELGRARDWDVFQSRILKPVHDAMQGEPSLGAMANAARRARRDAWDRVLNVVESERYRLLMIDLAAAVSARVWEDKTFEEAASARGKSSPYGRQIVKTARKCLDNRLERVKQLGDRIDDLGVAERHDLRIRLKKLRYAADFLQSCFDERQARKFIDGLSRLQDIFGELNDAAMGELRISELASAQIEGTDQHHLLRAGGLVTGWHYALSAQLWTAARKRWRRFEDMKLFWR